MKTKEAVKMKTGTASTKKRWMVIGTVTALVLALSMSLAYGSGRWGNHQGSGPAVSDQVMHQSGQGVPGFTHHDGYQNHDGYQHHNGTRHHDGYRQNHGYQHHNGTRHDGGMWTGSRGHDTRHQGQQDSQVYYGGHHWGDCDGYGGGGWR